MGSTILMDLIVLTSREIEKDFGKVVSQVLLEPSRITALVITLLS